MTKKTLILAGGCHAYMTVLANIEKFVLQNIKVVSSHLILTIIIQVWDQVF